MTIYTAMLIRTRADKHIAIFMGILPYLAFFALVLFSIGAVAIHNSPKNGSSDSSSNGMPRAEIENVAQVPIKSDLQANVGKPITGERWKVLIITWGVVSFIIFILSLVIPAYGEPERDKIKAIVLQNNMFESKFKLIFDVASGRHQIFKNTHRGWAPMQALFVANLVIVCIVVGFGALAALSVWALDMSFGTFIHDLQKKLMANETTVVVSFPLSVISMYLYLYDRIKKDYANKWLFCSNAIQKFKETDKNELRFYAATLILQMDLWSKRGFSVFFWETLAMAIDNQRIEESEKKDLRERMRKGELTEDEVEILFQKYSKKDQKAA